MGDKGAVAHVEDTAASFREPDIMGDPMRVEMLGVQTPEDPENGYGLGLSIRTTENGHVLAGHGGSVAGYNAYLVFDTRTGLGVVLLRNYNAGRTNLGRAANGLLEVLRRNLPDAIPERSAERLLPCGQGTVLTP